MILSILFGYVIIGVIVHAISTPTPTIRSSTPTRSPKVSEYEPSPTSRPTNATRYPTHKPSTAPVYVNDWPLTAFQRINGSGIDLHGKPGITLLDMCINERAGFKMDCEPCNSSASYDPQKPDSCKYNIADLTAHGYWASTYKCSWDQPMAINGYEVKNIYDTAFYLGPLYPAECEGLHLSETGDCPWTSLCYFEYVAADPYVAKNRPASIQCSSRLPCPPPPTNRDNAPTSSISTSSASARDAARGKRHNNNKRKGRR